MNASLLLVQLLNGLQLGVLLFLLSAGLTLVLGIMRLLNLSTGSTYMAGAYIAAASFGASGSFLVAAMASILGCAVIGVILERSLFSRLYERGHMDQVLVSFGIILVVNEVVRFVSKNSSLFVDIPEAFSSTLDLWGIPYPMYRVLVLAVGVAAAGALYLLIHRTRMGMLIRASASNPRILGAMGHNVGSVKVLVFVLSSAFAGLAGAMAAPLVAIQPGMGETVLILTLVVIVTGGVGSISGAFFGALTVGVVDTLGRALLPSILQQFAERNVAQAAGPALASVLIYLLMAIVLVFKPSGLFVSKHHS